MGGKFFHNCIKGFACLAMAFLVMANKPCFADDRYQIGYFRPSNTDSPYWKIYVNSNTSFESALGQASEFTQTSESVSFPYSDSYNLLVALYDLGIESYFANNVSSVPFYCNWDYFTISNKGYWLLTLNKDACVLNDISVSFPTSDSSFVSIDFPIVLDKLYFNNWAGNYARYIPFLYTSLSPYKLTLRSNNPTRISDFYYGYPLDDSTGNTSVYYDTMYSIFGYTNTSYRTFAKRFSTSGGIFYISYHAESKSQFDTLNIDLSSCISSWLSGGSSDPFYLIYSFDETSLQFYCNSLCYSTNSSVHVTPNFTFGSSGATFHHLASSFTTYSVNTINYTFSNFGDYTQFALFADSTNNIVNFNMYPFVPASFPLMVDGSISVTPTPLPTPTDIPPWRDSELPTPTAYPSVTVAPLPTGIVTDYIPLLDLPSTESIVSNITGIIKEFNSIFSRKVFALGSYTLQVMYYFSGWFKFIFIVPAGVFIAFLIGRLRKK